MKVIKTKVYTFNELSEAAKEVAIEAMRESYYKYNEFASWAIDDCSLLEPDHAELTKLFGKEYNFPLLLNSRNKLYFDTGRGSIDISNAMQVQNSVQFLQWLGLDKRLIAKIDYDILADSIEFSNQSENEFTAIQEGKIINASNKFADHCSDILTKLENDIDYRFTDEAIIEDIEANENQYTAAGNEF